MSYPVTFEADYLERRDRLTVFFRLILAIPLEIWLYIYAIVAYIAIVIACFHSWSPAPTHGGCTTSLRGSHDFWRASLPTRSYCATLSVLRRLGGPRIPSTDAVRAA